ncbi:MAG: AraC family transcriptional regulator, partial [Bacteroidota bacterium]
LCRGLSIRKEVEQHSLVREKDSTRQPPKAQTSAATVVPLSPADEVWLQRIKQLTQESLTQKTFSVEELADVAFLSPRQLRRKVKALTGIAPSKFIREIQLEVARQKLEEGLIPTLSEIAYTCGFEHQATFSRMFKTRYGLSPSQYVKRIMA